ncbi:HAD family acid phosphatase [Actinomadura sp. DC4]|uniref:HAD family acid phosphatase n=1 Tax=Actinomadura sp. DC4 TaxID=3055069 RepID=UPI0025B20233|nr:HAD family acid phosphatase [Actinomadura sp. DC4]MDN3355580.1 HAD family acid phosphatase [Actinomadura sp. DC4]
MPRTRIRLLTATAVAAATLCAVGAANATGSAPRSDREIPNLTDVVNEIKAYYGDTVDASGEHYASASSNYAKQVAGIEAKAGAYLREAVRHTRPGRKPAIVLDVDDTSLLTYNYELEVGFVYSPASNDAYIQNKNMAAVFGMPAVANWAADHGVTVFWITGRPETQRAATVRNLGAVGYTSSADPSHLYLNTKEPTAYLPCSAPTYTCTTTDYKSGTRKHIESLGYDIAADFGDQYSDLNGGYAGRTFKLPNPMYYLP